MAPATLRHFRTILEDHRNLRATLAQIDRLLADPPGNDARAGWLAHLAVRLRDARPYLTAHFAVEEEEGFFEEIRGALPSAGTDCERLSGEHQEILIRLDQILASIAAEPVEDAPFHSLAGRVRSLVKDLARHEEQENDLLFQVMDGGPPPQD